MVSSLYKQMENLDLQSKQEKLAEENKAFEAYIEEQVSDDESSQDTYKSTTLRLKAVGADCQDQIINHLCKNAEKLYIPKQVGPGDWLNSHKENG